MTLNIMKEWRLLLVLVIFFNTTSCTKDFLDEKPNSSIVEPHTFSDFRKLLDHQLIYEMPDLLIRSADEYYFPDSYYQSISTYARNAYIWFRWVYEGMSTVSDWNDLYMQVFYSNVVLQGLEKIEKNDSNRKEWDEIKGEALFVRALSFFTIAQLWAPPYNESSAINDIGIPIRLTADINAPTTRTSVKETYGQIIMDLLEAEKLVVGGVDLNNANRASKPAVLGLLSRVYLSMRKYSEAGEYANKCLQISNYLLDYSTLNITSNAPFPKDNNEVILYRRVRSNGGITNRVPNYRADTNIYKLFNDRDLRKELFYGMSAGNLIRKSDYSTVINVFCGIATDEIYLTRAECYAREGKVDLAIKDLNDLLRKRFVSGDYKDTTADNSEAALDIILIERRKELLTRSLRWTDCRRLNLEGRNISFKRLVEGEEYILPPNDKRWIYPIPPDVIALTGIPQNER